jgi:[ribosomal protein S18]-alanine N-acetyltransferase
MTGVRVRPARQTDLLELFALERSIPAAPHWPRGAYDTILAEEIFAPRRCLLVAAESGLHGFAVGVVHPAGDAELESVAVAEGARRQGIGASLCAAVVRWCRAEGATELLLEVRASSAGAIGLYTKLGFVAVGRRPAYYRDPVEDAVLMRLPLEETAAAVTLAASSDATPAASPNKPAHASADTRLDSSKER